MGRLLYYLWMIPATTLLIGVSVVGTVWIAKRIYELVKDIIKYY